MTLQEEFFRLIDLFQKASEGKHVRMEDVFSKSLEFIEHLKEQLRTGDEEDKQEAIRMMKELYQCMKDHTKMTCQREGITEEQLLANAENPAYFSPEQWQRIQETKERLKESSRQMVELVQNRDNRLSLPSQVKKERKKKRSKRSQWLRS